MWKNNNKLWFFERETSNKPIGMPKGTKLSEKTCLKMSKAKKGIKLSEDHKKKIGLSNKNVSRGKGHKVSLETRKKISESNLNNNQNSRNSIINYYFRSKKQKDNFSFKGKTHSKKTKEFLKNRVLGKNNPMWKGGITPFSVSRLTNAKWKKISKKVKTRDNFKCQICGLKKNVCLNVHHIIPYRISKNNNLENLITLCKKCHMTMEHNYNWRCF